MNKSIPRYIEKIDGECNVIVVDNPDLFNDEGFLVKKHFKPTNVTPKKKKKCKKS